MRKPKGNAKRGKRNEKLKAKKAERESVNQSTMRCSAKGKEKQQVSLARTRVKKRKREGKGIGKKCVKRRKSHGVKERL